VDIVQHLKLVAPIVSVVHDILLQASVSRFPHGLQCRCAEIRLPTEPLSETLAGEPCLVTSAPLEANGLRFDAAVLLRDHGLQERV
jgi:hypothetical protein